MEPLEERSVGRRRRQLRSAIVKNSGRLIPNAAGNRLAVYCHYVFENLYIYIAHQTLCIWVSEYWFIHACMLLEIWFFYRKILPRTKHRLSRIVPVATGFHLQFPVSATVVATAFMDFCLLLL